MDTKIFMFTGKGGVGKSSIASSHAILSAKKNIKTILISIDPAHSLSDIFDINFSSQVNKVLDNLWVFENDSSKSLKDNFPSIKNTLAENFRKVDFSKIDYTSSLDMPFISNILSMIKILDIYENGGYENIIVDCPASAATFSYLKLPEMFSWYLEKFFGVGKGIVRTLRPISKYKYKINLPEDENMDKIKDVHYKLLKLQNILTNKNITSIRLVSLAEKMVLEESKRDLSYLKLFNYNVDAIFINRLIKEDDCLFIKKRLEIQNKYLKEAESLFYNIPIYKLPMMKNDMKNLNDIEKFVREFDRFDDIFKIRKMNDNETFKKLDDDYLFSIDIGDIEIKTIYKKFNDINIVTKDTKRIITMPNILSSYKIKDYKIDKNILDIYLSCEQ